MMAAAKMAAVEDSGGRRQRRWRQTMGADDNGTLDWAAACNGEGREREANNDGIMHRMEKTMLFLAGVIQFFVVTMMCCFWRGSYNFVCGEVLLTKEKVIHMTLSTTFT
jgi:hypothetical protein